MIKINSEDMKILYKSPQEEMDYETTNERQREECIPVLEERLRLLQSASDKWQNDLLLVNKMLEKARKKMVWLWGGAGGTILLMGIYMMILTFNKVGSDHVMLATGIISFFSIDTFILIYFAMEATGYYGIHNEWKIFQRFVQKYKIITLKREVELLIEEIRQFQEEYERTDDARNRLVKGECLTEEEYQWAAVQMEYPKRQVHTEKLLENVLVWKK